jgi:hypothetical protein
MFQVSRRGILGALAAAAQTTEVWRFDRLDRLGGAVTQIEGQPTLVDSPWGKVARFNGKPDALFLERHPLAGVREFTWEVIFYPESTGAPEQRFFHLQEDGSQHRRLLETRLIGGKWCLDSYAASPTGSQTLIDRGKLHSLDAWRHVAMVYDGREFRHYVDHQLQGAATVDLAPLGPGRTSIGTRINRVDYFTGRIRLAAFHRRALRPGEMMDWR